MRPALNARRSTFVGGLIAATLAGAALAAPAGPGGTWRTQDGRARVRVETCGPARDRLCGYIVWLQDAGPDGRGGQDLRNPDRSKAGRYLLGHQIMLGLNPVGGAHYQGKIYNAEDGKSYDVEVWVAENGALQVKGCLLIFCKTESWTRTGDVEQGQLAGPTGGSNGPRADPEWAASPAGPADRRAPARRS